MENKKEEETGLSDVEKMLVELGPMNIAKHGIPRYMVEDLRKKIYAEVDKLNKTKTQK